MPKTQYNKQQFWQQKYKATICEHYQWYCAPSTFLSLITDNIPIENSKNILELGCGSSNLANQLLKYIKKKKSEQEASYTCIDFSKQIIKKQRLLSSRGNFANSLNYVVGDIVEIANMKGVGDQVQKYDTIIDKATIDCLFCNNNFIKIVLKVMSQCYKCLKNGGTMIIISSGPPKQRNYLFRNKLVPFSKLQYLPIKKGSGTSQDIYYIYFCFKGDSTQQKLGGQIIRQQEQQFSNKAQQFEQQQGQIKQQKQQQQEQKQQEYKKQEQLRENSQNQQFDDQKNTQKKQADIKQQQNENEKEAEYDMDDQFQS